MFKVYSRPLRLDSKTPTEQAQETFTSLFSMPCPPYPPPCLASFPPSQWPSWNLKASGYCFALWKLEDGVTHPLSWMTSEQRTSGDQAKARQWGWSFNQLRENARNTQDLKELEPGRLGYMAEWPDLILSNLSGTHSVLCGCWNWCCQETK